MTREEFEVYKNELMERFYWCRTKGELLFLTKEKGHKYLFRCTHYKTNKFFWVFDRTDELLIDVDIFHNMVHEKPGMKESEAIATE